VQSSSVVFAFFDLERQDNRICLGPDALSHRWLSLDFDKPVIIDGAPASAAVVDHLLETLEGVGRRQFFDSNFEFTLAGSLGQP
tara:strand:+ start:27 stop:278 length:252 start_codon:yes stop_codon:yes gene_type:complete